MTLLYPPILLAQAGLGLIDYAVLVAYLAATILIGSWLCRGQNTLSDYFLAGRSTHWLVACVSIIATDISALSYMGVPGWIYEKDLKYSVGALLYPFVMVVVVVIFVPVFFRLKVFTVYEYLETRFHPAARTLTAVLFMFQRGVLLAGAIYIPAVALSTFTGRPQATGVCILIIGAATTLYTLLGGMKAVIWTDFMQFIVMVGGLVLMILLLLARFGWNVAGVWAEAGAIIAPVSGTPHTTLVDWRLNLRTEATIWSILFFYLIYNLGTYGTDQIIVQRYFTMGSLRDIARSVIGAGLLSTVSVFGLAGLGLLLVVHYHQHPELAASLTRSDQVLPHFVTHMLPTGLRGLIFAAIMAATMSTISAGLNSFATVGIMDLYRRFVPRARRDERHALRAARVLTLVSGVLLTALALWVSRHQTTVLEITNRLASKFIGPVTGIFFLGILTRRGNLAGVMVGAAAGLMSSFLVDWKPVARQLDWMWTAPLSCLVTFTIGYLSSLITPGAFSRTPGITAVHSGATAQTPVTTVWRPET